MLLRYKKKVYYNKFKEVYYNFLHLTINGVPPSHMVDRQYGFQARYERDAGDVGTIFRVT